MFYMSYALHFWNKGGFAVQPSQGEILVMTQEEARYPFKTDELGVYRTYEPETFRVFSTLLSGRGGGENVVLDIGGWNGATSLFFANLPSVKQVVVLEPTLSAFQFLVKNVEQQQPASVVDKVCSLRVALPTAAQCFEVR